MQLEREADYASWVEQHLMNRKKCGPVPNLSREEVAKWAILAFASITAAIRDRRGA